MARYIANVEGNEQVIIATKAVRSGQQIVFYEADGRGIVAQLPATTPFYKAGE